MKIETKLIKEIERTQNKLKERVKTKGIYENFGQREVSRLKDKYIDISVYTDEMNRMRQHIDNFNNWCMIYNG